MITNPAVGMFDPDSGRPTPPVQATSVEVAKSPGIQEALVEVIRKYVLMGVFRRNTKGMYTSDFHGGQWLGTIEIFELLEQLFNAYEDSRSEIERLNLIQEILKALEEEEQKVEIGTCPLAAGHDWGRCPEAKGADFIARNIKTNVSGCRCKFRKAVVSGRILSLLRALEMERQRQASPFFGGTQSQTPAPRPGGRAAAAPAPVPEPAESTAVVSASVEPQHVKIMETLWNYVLKGEFSDPGSIYTFMGGTFDGANAVLDRLKEILGKERLTGINEGERILLNAFVDTLEREVLSKEVAAECHGHEHPGKVPDDFIQRWRERGMPQQEIDRHTNDRFIHANTRTDVSEQRCSVERRIAIGRIAALKEVLELNPYRV